MVVGQTAVMGSRSTGRSRGGWADGRDRQLLYRPKSWWSVPSGYHGDTRTGTVPVQRASGKSRLEATIDLNDFGITDKPIVLFEQDRPCTFDDGRITDAFTADGAHVYRVDGR